MGVGWVLWRGSTREGLSELSRQALQPAFSDDFPQQPNFPQPVLDAVCVRASAKAGIVFDPGMAPATSAIER